MATPFLGLNQYAGGDVVSYLDGGYNSDMSKIDTGVQNASQKADAVESKVGAIKAASDKNSADIVTLTNGLSSTNQNVTDLTSTVNLVKNDVFVQYTATLSSTTITISGSGGNSFYFIMPENFNTTFAYVVNGVICTLVNMGGTSFKNGQIAKGAPVFVRLIGTVMYAVGALESEGGVKPVDYAESVSATTTITGATFPENNVNLIWMKNLNLLFINGLARFATGTNVTVNQCSININTIPGLPAFTTNSTVYSLIGISYFTDNQSKYYLSNGQRTGTSVSFPDFALSGVSALYFQACLNIKSW